MKRWITPQRLGKLGEGFIFLGLVLLLQLLFHWLLWKSSLNLERVRPFAVGAGLMAVLLAIVLVVPKCLASLDLNGSEQRKLTAAEYLEAVNHRRSALLTAAGGGCFWQAPSLRGRRFKWLGRVRSQTVLPKLWISSGTRIDTSG
jgi:hypothetical protein